MYSHLHSCVRKQAKRRRCVEAGKEDIRSEGKLSGVGTAQSSDTQGEVESENLNIVKNRK